MERKTKYCILEDKKGGEKMYNHIIYISYWLVNAVVFYFVYRIFPQHFVLGNWKFFPVEGAIYSSFWLTFFVWTVWDFLHARGIKASVGVAANFYFWLINAVGILIVARFSQFLGLSISGFIWAIICGGIANVVQRFVWGLVTRRSIR